MAESGNFLAKFSQDLELIYARYSHSFDGSAEFSLEECDLADNVKQIENIRHGSLSQDFCLANSSYSSDENHGLMSYHKDEESGRVFTTPLGSSDEETTSSPNSKSDDILGWESGCSESAEVHPTANNNDPDLFVEKSNKPEKSFPSPSKTVSLKPSHDTDKALPSNYDSRLACTQLEHRREHSARNTTNENKYSGLHIGIDVASVLDAKICSTLLTAVHKFQNTVSNVLILSRNNHRHSQDPAFPLAVSEIRNYEKCFEKISQSLHGKRKFLEDQERKREQRDLKSRKSLDFQQSVCVFEKLFARPKGSVEEPFIEVASRQSLKNNTGNLRHTSSALLSASTSLGGKQEWLRSPNHNTNHKSLLSTEASDEGVSSPAGVNGGDSFRDAKRCGTQWGSTPQRDSSVSNSGNKPDHNLKSLRHGQKNSLDPIESPRAILPLQGNWGTSSGGDRYDAYDVKPWRTARNEVPKDGVISLDIKTTRGTQCRTPYQASPSSEDTSESKLLSNRSPLVISPRVESSATGRRSVPLRATPGCDNVMRMSEVAVGFPHQTSTPDKWAICRSDERKVKTTLSPDPETFFKQRKIPQPRRSLMAPGNLTSGDSTPSPIRPLSSSQRDQFADKSSAPMDARDDHAGGSCSRRRLYARNGDSPRVGQTSEVTQRAQSKSMVPVSESIQQQASRLAGKRVDGFNGDFLSSNDDSPRSPRHSLKIKNTPRRNSTGCHPYTRYSPSSRRESPSLASPLQALYIPSPSSSCDESVRWSTLMKHSAGKRPVLMCENSSKKPANNSEKLETKPSLLVKKNPPYNAARKKKGFHQTEECEVTHDRSEGNCTKKFCFNCSMDCS